MLSLEHVMLRNGAFTLSVDLTLQKGQRLGLIGASGSGKSTLLNLVAGFLVPDTGRILIDGSDVSRTDVASRPLGILFQDGNLFPHLSAFDNVALGLRPDLRLSESQREAVTACLDQVGMAAHADRLPKVLSGGQQSRVALARMLLRDKPLALLDEPFSALDPGLRRDMLGLVSDLCDQARLTLILVTHDLREVQNLCTDLCLLDKGQVTIRGEMQTILSDPPAALRPWL
ncbi:MAG: ATP-binding cassette domain-containing protein [Rhodobacteraceae bacterium]|nr:ATP-binding cassette domain-containing protein [Paracoccaceae bacterium]